MLGKGRGPKPAPLSVEPLLAAVDPLMKRAVPTLRFPNRKPRFPQAGLSFVVGVTYSFRRCVSNDALASFLRFNSPNRPEPALIPRDGSFWSNAMEHQRHFDTSEAEQREAVKIRKMIGDLDRSVQLLNCDIASEEERTRISDRSDAAYSILARMLAIRRDNLRDTVAALERRLPRPDQAELVAELA
jgi:hypothetical protein